MGDFCQCGAEDLYLSPVQLLEIIGSQPPFYFGIAGECAGAGTGDVSQNAIEGHRNRQITSISDYDLDRSRVDRSVREQKSFHQACSMRVYLEGCNDAMRIQIRHSERLASGSGTAIENSATTTLVSAPQECSN
ncbi:MAG: hypothetical protein ABSG34_01235 [Candidatus Sulfotelmatobacter sp.]